MGTKIGKAKGYDIIYDSSDKLFHLCDSAGEEVGSGKTQQAVENQADKLAKQAYHFPIAVLLVSGDGLHEGKITSLNIEDESVRFTDADKSYYGRLKLRLNYRNFYQMTEGNREILDQVRAKRGAIQEIENEIRLLIGHLEKPINLAYFNLSS